MRAHWLACTVSPGQFSNEYVVKGTTYDHKGFSLFCPEEYVEVKGSKEPTWDEPAQGRVQVQIAEKKGNLLLVRLPRHTLENGPYVTVLKEQVMERSIKQRA